MRPITFTPVFSKLCEGFLCDWLKIKIIPRIDIRQFGNLRKTSTTHYLVHLIHTILSELEKPNVWPNLVLVDFQKAFDLVDHTILIRLLHDNFEIDPLLVNIDRGRLTPPVSLLSNPNLLFRSMLLQRGFVKVLSPVFWNTLIIIRDYVLAKFPFSSIAVFILFLFTAMFL